MFRSLKTSLNYFFEKEKIKPIYHMGVIASRWEEVVGETVKENTKIINLKNNILIIKTTTPVWRNELLFQKKSILKKLNTNHNKITIKDIKFI